MENKRAVGRPSLLLEKMDQAKQYLHGAWQDFGDVVPSIAGLACYLGVTRETIYNYQKENTEFFDIVSGILAVQERQLVNGGLSGGYNANITKLLLSKHGYSEKQEIDHHSSDGSLGPTKIVFNVVGDDENAED